MNRPTNEMLRIEDLALKGVWPMAFLLAGLALAAGMLAEVIAGLWGAVITYGAVMSLGCYVLIVRATQVRRALSRSMMPPSREALAAIQRKIRRSSADSLRKALLPSVLAVYLLLLLTIMGVWGDSFLRQELLLLSLLLATFFAFVFLWVRSLGRR